MVQKTEEELFEQYLYRFDELDVFLKDVGFASIKKYPAFDGTKTVDQTTSIIIYECVKCLLLFFQAISFLSIS